MFDVLPGGAGLLIGASALVGVALYLWYLVAMSQLFPRLGLPASQGFIPVLNEWKLLAQTGLPGWVVLFVFVPPLFVVFWVVRTIAMHRVGVRTGAPVWVTVVGAVLPPLWASIVVARFNEAYAPVVGYSESAPAVTSNPSMNGDDDAEFQQFLQGLQSNSARARAQRDPEPGLAPAPQLFDTEAHVLPPITPEALAAVLGERPVPGNAGAASAAQPVSGVTPGVMPGGEPGVRSQADPLGASVQAEYERLASEAFLAPPATPFGDTVPQPRFSWEAAVQQPAQPAPPVAPPTQAPFLAPQRNPLTQAIPVHQPRTVPQPETQAPAPAPAPAQAPAKHDAAAKRSDPYDLPPLHPASMTMHDGHGTRSPGADGVDGANATVGARPAAVLSTADFLAAIRSEGQGADLIPAEPDDETLTNLPNDDGGSGGEAHPAAGLEVDTIRTDAAVVGGHSQLVSVENADAAHTDFAWVLEFDSGVVVQLHPDTIIGRAPVGSGTAVGVAVADETRTLSKAHARFTFVGRLWLVEDLGSTNGVRLVHPDGSESLLAPHDPARATAHLWLGTLRATLREGLA